MGTRMLLTSQHVGLISPGKENPCSIQLGIVILEIYIYTTNIIQTLQLCDFCGYNFYDPAGIKTGNKSFQGCSKCLSRMYKESFIGVCRSFEDVSQWCFLGVPGKLWVFLECCKKVLFCNFIVACHS